LLVAVGVSDSCFPGSKVTVGLERRIDWVKMIAEDRILDRDFLSVVVDNFHLFLLDNFIGGYKL
jgi:hypothetical protein